jgi:hypothetical protein
MLRARVISEGVRATFPAVLNGMYTPEEVQEFDAPRPVRAVKVEPVVEVKAEPVVEPVAVPATETKAIEAEVVSNDTAWADELEKRIFEHEPKVNAFLVAKGQISEGQTFRDMTDEGYRNRILSSTPRFLETVLAEVKEVK